VNRLTQVGPVSQYLRIGLTSSTSRRAGAQASGSASGIGRADGAKLDVGIGHRRVGRRDLDLRGHTRGDGASSTSNIGGVRTARGRVVAVEPEQVGLMIVPDRHDENDALG
jgi:hypothetical protein